MSETDFKRARDKCYRLLAYRSRTVYELRHRLEQAGFSSAVTEAVLDELQQKKLLDDESFARNWIRRRITAKPVGTGYLWAELQQKGVDRDTIAAALGDYDEDSEYEAAMRVVCKKLNQDTVGKNWYRMAGLLSRRGFSGSVVNRVYRTLTEDGRFDIS